jgi:hypothetical protein
LANRKHINPRLAKLVCNIDDAICASDFDPQSLGLDRERLTQELRKVDKQRRFKVQNNKAENWEPGVRAALFDNGDFRYIATLDKIQSVAGGYALAITSQLKSSTPPRR